MEHTTEQILAAARSEAFAFGRCCDLYQDGFGQFHCTECGQRTFAMLRGVQKVLGNGTEQGMAHDEAAASSLIRRAAPELLEVCEEMLSLFTDGFTGLPCAACGNDTCIETCSCHNLRAAIAKATKGAP